MTMHLVVNEDDERVWAFDPAVLDDWFLVRDNIVIHPDEVEEWDSRELAWQITHRVLSVQRWARYYAMSTHGLAALSCGLTHTSWR